MIPLQTCNHVGCNTLIPFNQRYCQKHRTDFLKPEKHSRKWNYGYRKRIYGKYQKFYHSYRWTKVSRNYRTKHPFCVRCYQKGLYIRARAVDHIIPIRTDEGWKKRWDESNFQSLCIPCHNKKSLEDEKKYHLNELNYKGGGCVAPSGARSGSSVFKNV